MGEVLSKEMQKEAQKGQEDVSSNSELISPNLHMLPLDSFMLQVGVSDRKSQGHHLYCPLTLTLPEQFTSFSLIFILKER